MGHLVWQKGSCKSAQRISQKRGKKQPPDCNKGRRSVFCESTVGKCRKITPPPWASEEDLASGHCAEGFGTFRAGADVTEMVVAIDAGGMAIGKANLDCVVANLRGGLGLGLRLEHG